MSSAVVAVVGSFVSPDIFFFLCKVWWQGVVTARV